MLSVLFYFLIIVFLILINSGAIQYLQIKGNFRKLATDDEIPNELKNCAGKK